MHDVCQEVFCMSEVVSGSRFLMRLWTANLDRVEEWESNGTIGF
jgi:hypothetical protein